MPYRNWLDSTFDPEEDYETDILYAGIDFIKRNGAMG
jgi:hypothetical protein